LQSACSAELTLGRNEFVQRGLDPAGPREGRTDRVRMQRQKFVDFVEWHPRFAMSSLCALEFALPRAYWNGFLKLSFVSCAVALYPATTAAERVSFRQVNRRTGHRLKHQLVDSITPPSAGQDGRIQAGNADQTGSEPVRQLRASRIRAMGFPIDVHIIGQARGDSDS
jgi:hypothetical protein